MAPLVPAGTRSALATTEASKEFKVETTGCARPVGQSVRYESTPGGTTVAFREYARAAAEIPQALDGTVYERVPVAASTGPPNSPFASRVSETRQGLTGKKD